jgi:hypothetical protein
MLLPLSSAILSVGGYFVMFSTPHDWLYLLPYDDESYWLSAIRSYHLHGSLYHHTYSQCGPFYYEFWSLLYSISRLPIDADSAHFWTLTIWVATSLVFGVALAMISRRVLLGLVGQLVVFVLLMPLASEPMEPAGLAYLLVGFVVLGIALLVRGYRRLGPGLVGVAVSCLVLTKVNIGLFVLAGLVFAVVVYWPIPRWTYGRILIAGCGLLCLPALLMANVLNEQWVQWYVAFEMLLIVGLIAITTTKQNQPKWDRALEFRSIFVCIAAGGGAALLVASGVLINGTSLSELVNGGLLSQRGLATKYQVALPMTKDDLVFAVLATIPAVAIGVSTYARERVPSFLFTRAAAIVRVGIGVWILIAVLHEVGLGDGVVSDQGLCCTSFALIPHEFIVHLPGASFLLTAPLAWVAAIGTGEDAPTLGFTRVALCAVAILSTMTAFPSAGAQLAWSSLTLAPVAVLCLWDGLAMLTAHSHSIGVGIGKVQTASIGLALLAAVLISGVVGPLLTQYRTIYFQSTTTRLAGAERIHTDPWFAHQWVDITAFLKSHCSTYWSLPGLNAFYFFSGEAPPSDLITTQWMNLLSDRQQNEILAALVHTPRLCAVEDKALLPFWDQHHPLRQTALVRYVENEFVVVKTEGAYALLVRKS